MRQVMTVLDHQPTIVDQLLRWWHHDPRIHQVPPAWAVQPVLAGASPADLVDRWRSEGEAVLAALVRLAGDDDLAALCAVMVLLPAVKGLIGRLSYDGENNDDLSARVVAVLFERIRVYPWRSRRGTVAGNLSADVLKAVVRGRAKILETPAGVPTVDYDRSGPGCRAQTRRSDQASRPSNAQLGNLTGAAPSHGPTAAEELIEVLVDAVGDGVLSVDEARVIVDHRIRGVSAEQAAASRGVQPQSIRRRRQRAEAALIEAMAAA